MEIRSVVAFIEYRQRIRARTEKVIGCIPPDRFSWSYKSGKFTFGDLVRHLATTERYMFAENVAGRPSCYPGCGPDIAEGFDETMALYDRLYRESMDIYASLEDADLDQKCMTPGGAAIRKWKWLRSMIEHEVHHRGQIYVYLSMNQIAAPPLYGLTAEDVLAKSVPFEPND